MYLNDNVMVFIKVELSFFQAGVKLNIDSYI